MNQEVSVSELCSLFLNGHAKIFKKSWKQDEKYIDRYIRPVFGNRDPASIKRGEIEVWHKAFEGKFMANRILTLLCSIFNKGIEWDIITDNPAKRIRKFPEKERDLFIPREDLSVFLKTLDNLPLYFSCTLRFMLLTGIRKKEALNLKWEDISEGLVIIKDRKNGHDLYIPITNAVNITLKATPRLGEYVFTHDGKKQADYKNQWNQLRDRLRKKNFLNKRQIKFNDIRRTFASYLGQDGVNAKLIAECLGQVDIKSTQRYIRFQLDHVKKAMENLPSLEFH